ncbi:MAG: DUF1176 domain-containing protein [Pseudomonadota bacterium]|nr:DUF1176 domain-containing protein [Pseudomonadota bacterium]
MMGLVFLMRRATLCAVAGLAVLGAPAQAAGLTFSHLDWELACDNTRTCRAAGYSASEAQDPVSVLLTRPAGAAAQVKGEITVGDEGPGCPKALRVQGMDAASANVPLNTQTCQGKLSAAQVAFVLREAASASSMTFASADQDWTLSLHGARAVLLKMDEAQGRLNTPTALVRKGTRPASDVLPPLAAPVIRVPKLPAVRRQDHALLPQIAAALRAHPPEDCRTLTGEDTSNDPAFKLVARLSDTQLLVSALCWRAAYNEGYGFWVVQDQPPHAAQLVTAMGGDYADGLGEISYWQKGRGIGDCVSTGAWAWNGQAFVMSAEGATGMCRGFLGGAWQLPTHVSTVVRRP